MAHDLSHLTPAEKRALLARLLDEEAASRRYPLSFGQRRLWFLEGLEGGARYNMAAVIRLNGPLQPALLARCINEIVRRHSVLRARYGMENNEVWQTLAAPTELPLPCYDLRHSSSAAQQADIAARAVAEQQTAFDLENGPLVRSQLLQLAATEHVWLLTVHHSVSDGWSLGVFLRELAALYPALVAGKPDPLPPLPCQYVDYVQWQHQHLSEPRLAGLLADWRQQLAGAPALLELPTDFPRPPVQSGHGRLHKYRLDPALTAPLKQLARAAGGSLFMPLLAAFAVLLARHSGQTDLVIGTPVANRTQTDHEALIGFFVNTLALRLDLSGNPSFQTLLARTRQTVLGAFSRQALPFEKLVEELHLERDLSRNPLFQVMFALQSHPAAITDLGGGLTLALQEREQVSAKFDLSLDVWEDAGALVTAWEYSSDLFSAERIERLAAQYGELLAGLLAAPQQALGRLPLLSAAARRVLLEDWSGVQALTTATPSALALFEAEAERRPHAPAVALFGAAEAALSYGELDRRATALAAELRAAGVGRETLVALRLERSPAFIVALLAVHKAGGAYLPIDPDYPAERIRYLLDDSGSRILLEPDGLRLIGLPQAAPRPGPLLPEQLAYVIYTSGSTGRPKGVAISQQALAAFVAAARHRYGFNARDRILQFAALSFDAAVEEIFGALCHGATLWLRDDSMVQDARAFTAAVEAAQLTILDLPTAYWQRLTFELERDSLNLPASVRLVIVGGEALPVQALQQWQRQMRPPLLNTYGPTEATVVATVAEVSRTVAPLHVPIGRALTHVSTYVLDDEGEPVPVGVVGELHLGGVGLARGYLQRPALTAERFIPDPFARTPGGRLYRTGDRVRLRADGELEYIGRRDAQVKLRGFRIELGEVETALTDHPEVREAAAAVQADSHGGRLVAYWTPRSVPGPAVAVLRDFLKERLPHYMLPAELVRLERLPLSTNGKVDRQALPAVAPAAAVADQYVAARNTTEQTLAAIWAAVLDRAQVGIHDNFFELGGDSILGIQVTARAQQAGLALRPRQLFQHQTIAELALVAVPVVAPAPVSAAPVGAALLTPIQEWFFAQPLPVPQRFNQAIMLLPAPELTATALAAALATLPQRHEALRLRFQATAAGWRQTAVETAALALQPVDLRTITAAEQPAALAAAAETLQAGLDLEHGPLLAAAWIDLGAAGGVRVLLVAHHLICDGVSWRVLLEDIAALWRGQTPPVPPVGYRQWAVALGDYAQSAALRAELPYWQQQQAAVPPYEHQGNTVGNAAELSSTLDAATTRTLQEDLPRSYRVGLEEALLTALLLGWQRVSGERSLLLELEGHGREDLGLGLDISRTVGWFTTLYPLRLNLPAGNDPGAALAAVKEQLHAVPQRGIGYGLLRYLCRDEQVRATLAALPQPAVSFNYLGRFDSGQSAPWQGLAPEVPAATHYPQERRNYLLELNSLIVGDRLRLDWRYDPTVQPRTEIERLAETVLEVLNELCSHCRQTGRVYTPSDFPEAGLDQRALAALAKKLKRP